MSSSFMYSSQPHSAPVKSKLYRNQPPENDVTLNLMSDPRVVRGNTFSMMKKVTKTKADLAKSVRDTRKEINTTSPPESSARPSYRFDVKPLADDEIELSKFLVQQDDFPKRKKAVENQTDVFLPRPITPDYIPAKIGADVGTQVEDVSELFDFDIEVQPLLEVIVQKTIEQAVFEVEVEEELATLEDAAHLFRTNLQEQEEWKKTKETEALKEAVDRDNKVQEMMELKRQERDVKTYIAGLHMIRQIMPDLVDGIFEQTLTEGRWRDPGVATVEDEILPELMEDLIKRNDAHLSAISMVDELLKCAEEKFDSIPMLENPERIPSEMEVLVRSLNSNNEEAEENNEKTENETENEEGEVENKEQKKPVVEPTSLFSIIIKPTDTLQSVIDTIRAEIKKVKPSEEAIAEDPTKSTLAQQITEFASGVNVKEGLIKTLTPLIQAENAVTNVRELLIDGCLGNFSLPSKISLVL